MSSGRGRSIFGIRRGITRRQFASGIFATAGLAAFSQLGLTGCSSSNSSSTALSETSNLELPSVVIGTMPTEDTLPYYVAVDQGLFEQHGLDAKVEFFQSAQELSVAITSGDVQLVMTDIMVAASLYASGVDLTLEWVTLGTDASQGRFGVMVPGDSPYTSLADLAGVPVGVGSDTVPEYVFDVLMERAGVPDDQIVGEEIKKLPVRYQMMVEGQVAAAALPGSMLALGEASGCITLADDTEGDNISASVMAVRTDFYASEAGAAALAILEEVWDEAALMIDADPDAYRDVLIANANLSDLVADTYPIATYPTVTKPEAELVSPILDWMLSKGYLDEALSYDEATGSFS